MSQRARRAAARRQVIDEEEEYEEQEQKVAQRSVRGRNNRARVVDEEEDNDYAPGAAGKDTEDPQDDDIDADAFDADDDEQDRGKGGNKRRSAGGSAQEKKRARQPREGMVIPKVEIDLSGPINVPPAAVQRAETQIINYQNQAELVRTQFQSSSRNAITQQGINTLVRMVVRHMIFANSERPGIPISRAEITKLISEHSAAGVGAKKQSLSSLIIPLAQAKLAETFGLSMVEITKPPMRAKDRGPAATGEGTKFFVIRSLLPAQLYGAVVQRPEAAAVHGFLAVIMSLIEMAGGSIEDQDLWRHLNDLAVHKMREHPGFGGRLPSTLIEEFVKKRQLHVERVVGSDGPEVYYSIAENAHDEIGSEQLAMFYQSEFQ